ncbi:MAG: peptidoglycan DD-metalloendopeptidase family protein [Desulfovibrio sp.]|uniref:M23 family metallopeptidase n=1 Tax=Desulfovibrio sp. TaxID=885 RepID=UPI0039E70F59
MHSSLVASILLVMFAVLYPVPESAAQNTGNRSMQENNKADAASVTPSESMPEPAPALTPAPLPDPVTAPDSAPKPEENQPEGKLQNQAEEKKNLTEDNKQPETPDGTLPSVLAPRQLPPLKELLTSPFGPRRMPTWLSRRGMVVRDHSGIDLRARLDWPVVAFRSGKVMHAGKDGLSGVVVDILQDDGMTARYAHLGKTLVKKGQEVSQGTPVGLVGCTGRTTGAHLHFGLRDTSGKLVDPLPFLTRGEDVLRPAPEDIPEQLTPQTCGPVMRGRDGRPARAGRSLKELENYTPPPIPRWEDRH